MFCVLCFVLCVLCFVFYVLCLMFYVPRTKTKNQSPKVLIEIGVLELGTRLKLQLAGGDLGDPNSLCYEFCKVGALSMSTNFGSAGIPGTRLKVCVWGGGVVGGSHTHYHITPVQDLELEH